MASRELKTKIIRLNVGGTRYDVSRDTLERSEGSMLASLVSEHWQEGNSDEPIFIDRNGRLFEYVLDFLRTNKLLVPPSVSRAALKEEFQYYGIDPGIVFETSFVDLNVGCTLYQVSRALLLRRSGSKLARLVLDNRNKRNLEEPILIDRNGRLFECVLDYLRTDQWHLPPSANRAAVKEEFEYYGIADGMECEARKFANTIVVELDVGGTLYKVSRETLRNNGSMLSRLGNSYKNEPIFINRNGFLFQYVLDYLRTGICRLPISASRDAVQEEFKFYGLDHGLAQHDNTVFHKFGTHLIRLWNELEGVFASADDARAQKKSRAGHDAHNKDLLSQIQEQINNGSIIVSFNKKKLRYYERAYLQAFLRN